MHSEVYEITQESADILNKAMSENRRIIAIGTTSVRTLEANFSKYGKIQPTKEATNIFIVPGYEYKVVKALITNFHLPKSTLIIQLNTGFNGWAPAIKEKITEFTFDVTPKPHHWETDTEVTLPITEPGAYIVRTLPEGTEGTEGTYSKDSWYENLIWITPEILSKESVTKGRFLTLNDSKTGAPLADRKLKIMNYRTIYANNRNQNEFGGRRYRIIVKEFEVTTGKDGAVIFPERLNDRTLILSESEDGLTFLPHAYYSTINAGRFYERDRDYIITDRPVYRPGDTVKYTVYTRRASYDEKPRPSVRTTR